MSAIQLIKKTCEKTGKTDLVIMRRALEATFHPGLTNISLIQIESKINSVNERYTYFIDNPKHEE